jgi:DNA processing protein
METLRACALLARAPGLTTDHVHAAIAQAGSLEAAAEPHNIEAWGQLPPAARTALSNPNLPLLDADLRWMKRSGATLVPCTSAAYPAQLARVPGMPAVLYLLGDPALLKEPQLAIVGSRHPTPVGSMNARDFATFFARSGLIVTSGLALGIDAASHEGALFGGGHTIAICGNGLDRVYPSRHASLAEKIRARGALVSEFPPGTRPLKHHFPQRNRIISGLALGTLVIEAAANSGSLITARCAADQGREVFAVPGSIHAPQSRGCHQLIREGATLVERGADVLCELKFSLQAQPLEVRKAARGDNAASALALDKEYEMLLDALGFEPTGIDALVERTSFPSESVASMLLILELEGRVAPHAGGLYCRLPRSPR